MAKADITAERLRELMDYNPETGEFWWRVRRQKVRFDRPAGSKTEQGYIRIRIDGEGYRAHRLAWLHVHGVWPSNVIDHINRVRTDNRLENLRDVTFSENGKNRFRKSGISIPGVYRSGTKFTASINLGMFSTAADAAFALKVASERLL